MNNKQLKNLLKKKAENYSVPNASDEILKRVNHTPYNERAKIEAMKRSFMRLVSLTATMSLAILLVPLTLTREPEEFKVTETEQLLSHEIVTVSSFVAESAQVIKLMALTQEEKDTVGFELSRLLSLGSSFINNDNIETVLTLNTDSAYAKNFNYKLQVFDKTDISDVKTYVIYYNETYEFINQNSTIFGVYVNDNKEYSFTAEKTVSSNGVQIKLTLDTGNDSHVSITSNSDINTHEYSLELVDGEKIKTGFIKADGNVVEFNLINGDSVRKYIITYGENPSCKYINNGVEETINLTTENGKLNFIL